MTFLLSSLTDYPVRKEKYQTSVNVLKNFSISLAEGNISSNSNRVRVGCGDVGTYFHVDLDLLIPGHCTQVCTNALCIWASRTAPVISIS